MPSGFHSLPDELLEKILATEDSQATLRSLTVASRSFYRVFFPYLYRNICIWDAPKSKNLRTLARTLLANPEVGTRVQSFTLRQTPLCGNDIIDICCREETARSRLPFLRGHPSSRLERLRQQCGQARGPDGRRFNELCANVVHSLQHSAPWDSKTWLTSLDRADEDALVVLLLHLMPNLRYLDTSVSKSVEYALWEVEGGKFPMLEGPFASSALSGRNFLGQLTEAKHCIVKDQNDPQVNVVGVKLLYYHLMNPKMQKVCVRNMPTSPPDTYCQYVKDLHVAPMSSSVHHLEIREFTIHSDNIIELVGSCRNLRTFIYEHAKVYWNPERIDAVLSPTKSTLETLWLGFSCLRWEAANYRQPMISLSDYKVLRRLRLSMRAVFTTTFVPNHHRCIADLVPQSLEFFHLKDCNYKRIELVDALTELLRQREKEGKVPTLKEIVIDTPLNDLTAGFAGILDTAATLGIYFILRDTSPGYSHKDKAWGYDENEGWYDNAEAKSYYQSQRAVYPLIVRKPYSKFTSGHLERLPPLIRKDF